MKIYIFKTSNWWYCGGGAVAIAESIEQASDLFNEVDKEETHRFSYKPFEKEGSEQWELVEALDTNETIARVILIEYNYA